MICRRCLVRGRVQGVAFRAHTQRRARELAVTGYARNLQDGSVEILACGHEKSVAALCDWLWTGAPASRVVDVHCDDTVSEAPDHFETF